MLGEFVEDGGADRPRLRYDLQRAIEHLFWLEADEFRHGDSNRRVRPAVEAVAGCDCRGSGSGPRSSCIRASALICNETPLLRVFRYMSLLTASQTNAIFFIKTPSFRGFCYGE